MSMPGQRWKPLMACVAVIPLLTCCGMEPARPLYGRHEIVGGRDLLNRLELQTPVDFAAGPVISAPDENPNRSAPAFSMNSASPDNQERARACLTAAIYYEARSESADGQRAVAQVVLNRVRDRAFPNSVCGVVYQGASRRTGCQFSFTCDGSIYRPREPNAWATARNIADQGLGGRVYASVGSATFYHADTVDPWWSSSLSRIGSIGAHIFYRWRSALDHTLAFRQTYSGVEPLVAQAFAGRPVAEQSDFETDSKLVAGVLIHRESPDTRPISANSDDDTTASTVADVTIHRGATHEGSKVRIHLGNSVQTAGFASDSLGSHTGS